MDRENLKAIIARYLDQFDLTNSKPHEEHFKWQAAACFHKYWDPDAANMPEMFTAATKEFSVLFDGSNSTPTSGIKELLKKPEEVELVRSAFKSLLADDYGDLRQRENHLWQFIDTINDRVNYYWPGSHLFLQSMRSAIGYLAMAKPAENYFYIYSKAENWANCVEFGEDIGSGSSFSLSSYYRMCDELVQVIESSDALRECSQKRIDAAIADNKNAGIMPDDFRLDDQYHMLVYDVIYCATTYNLFIDIPHYPKGVSKRIQRSHDRHELELLRADYLAAEKKYDELKATSVFPSDMVGLKVSHKVFGEGTIITHTGFMQEVDFSGVVKAFVYPEAYVKRFLIPLPEAVDAINDNVHTQTALTAAAKDYDEKKSLFEKKKESFDKQWVKNAHAVEEDEVE